MPLNRIPSHMVENVTTGAKVSDELDIITKKGTTAQRPSTPIQGQPYYDTTLGKPIWYSGTAWKDAVGTTV